MKAEYDAKAEKWVITDDRTQITVTGKVRSQVEERLAELVTRYHHIELERQPEEHL